MPRGLRYSETLDQPALAAVFDLEAARQRCPSFHKFCRDVERLLTELAQATPELRRLPSPTPAGRSGMQAYGRQLSACPVKVVG
jgi:hypothetical protein